MRSVFFSFDYDDVKNFKVNVVRNSWLLKETNESFVDRSIWEKSKLKTPAKIKALIDTGIIGTSVTAILVGDRTATRRFVKYEIVKSFERGNGLISIYINRVRGTSGLTSRGRNPFDRLALQVSSDGEKIFFFELKNYKWRVFKDLPCINNNKTNSIYFEKGFFFNKYGETFRFSQLFKTYCWDKGDGNNNVSSWVDEAARQARRHI